ncbi:MAG: aminopeptidase P family protein [Geminicoccaceae bacterium]|nr:aminopeptidase P family protein [Geminicoccaceae bacterium]
MSRGPGRDELVTRCGRTQALMEAMGLDLLLATTEPEVRYLTGFRTPFWQSPTRPWFVLLPLRGAPHAVIPAIGEVCMERCYTASIRSWPSPAPEDEGVTLLAATINELVSGRCRVGLAMGPETHLRMPLGDFATLKALLPGVIWRDATRIWRQLRMVKSEREIACIREAGQRTCDAFEALGAYLEPGLSEIEIFRRMRIEALQAGVDDVPYLVGGAGRGGYGDIISLPTSRPVGTGDVLVLDVGATFDGYHCDFDRNFAVGQPDAAVSEAYRQVHEALDAGLEAVRPGASCADLHRVMSTVLRGRGGGRDAGNVGRLGHGIGMQLTEWPSITDTDDTVLEVGMVLALEPGLVFSGDRAMVHEENIVVRDQGAELLTRRAPPVIPVI